MQNREICEGSQKATSFLYETAFSIILIVFYFTAPSGCLQWYSKASGQFRSFNYRSEPALNDGPNHLANLNYAVCFRIENGFCGMKYGQVTTEATSFTISGDSSTITATMDALVKYGDQDCAEDYVVIAGKLFYRF